MRRSRSPMLNVPSAKAARFSKSAPNNASAEGASITDAVGVQGCSPVESAGSVLERQTSVSRRK